MDNEARMSLELAETLQQCSRDRAIWAAYSVLDREWDADNSLFEKTEAVKHALDAAFKAMQE